MSDDMFSDNRVVVCKHYNNVIIHPNKKLRLIINKQIEEVCMRQHISVMQAELGLKSNEEKDKWLDNSTNVLSRRHWLELRRYVQHDNFQLKDYYGANAEAYLRYYNSY